MTRVRGALRLPRTAVHGCGYHCGCLVTVNAVTHLTELPKTNVRASTVAEKVEKPLTLQAAQHSTPTSQGKHATPKKNSGCTPAAAAVKRQHVLGLLLLVDSSAAGAFSQCCAVYS
jgi:hypothetical protein